MHGTEVDRRRRVDVRCHPGGSDAEPDRPRTGSTLEVARSESRPCPVTPPGKRVVAVSTTVEQFTEPLAFHGEGPVWSPDWAGLRFVDMLAGDIVSIDPTGALLDRLHVGSVAAAVRPRRTGGLGGATERGFALVDPNGAVHRLPDLWTDPRVRMNDGGCDPQGRFYCGSLGYDLYAGA